MRHNVLKRFMLFSANPLKLAQSALAKIAVAVGMLMMSPLVLAQKDDDCGEAMSNYWQLGLAEGVSPLSSRIVGTDYAMLMICTIIGVIVFGAMFFSIIFHRKGRREPAQFHHSTVVELIWTVVPVLILVGIAVWVVGLLLDQEDNSNADMTIEVTGYQWLWEYNYPEDNISFYSKLSETSNEKRRLGEVSMSDSFSRLAESDGDCYLSDVDNPLVIPANKKILMKVSAEDVVHAWSVDAFDFKMDAYPQITNERWLQANKPGTYRGWCKELCGRDHAFMPIVVEVLDSEDTFELDENGEPVLDDKGNKIIKEPSEWTKWLTEQRNKQQGNSEGSGEPESPAAETTATNGNTALIAAADSAE